MCLAKKKQVVNIIYITGVIIWLLVYTFVHILRLVNIFASNFLFFFPPKWRFSITSKWIVNTMRGQRPPPSSHRYMPCERCGRGVYLKWLPVYWCTLAHWHAGVLKADNGVCCRKQTALLLLTPRPRLSPSPHHSGHLDFSFVIGIPGDEHWNVF